MAKARTKTKAAGKPAAERKRTSGKKAKAAAIPGPTPEQIDRRQQMLIKRHSLAIMEAEDAQKEAATETRKAVDLAKADGFSSDNLKCAVLIRRGKAPEIADKIEQIRYISRLMGDPLADQLELFNARSVQSHNYYAEGHTDAIDGKGCFAPEGLAYEDVQKYVLGWQEGHEAKNVELAEGFKPLGATMAATEWIEDVARDPDNVSPPLVDKVPPATDAYPPEPIGTEPPTYTEAAH